MLKIKSKHILCFEDKIKTHFVFNSVELTFYEIMRKYTVQQGRPQITIWRMLIACWITKPTDTNSEYVILIDFPRQKWLRERTSMLHYTYFASFIESVCVFFVNVSLHKSLDMLLCLYVGLNNLVTA